MIHYHTITATDKDKEFKEKALKLYEEYIEHMVTTYGIGKEHYTLDEHSLLIAYDDHDNVVGVCAYNFYEPNELWLCHVYVKKSHRMRGIYSAMTRILYTEAKRQNCDKIIAGILNNNYVSLEAHKCLGFHSTMQIVEMDVK